MGKVIRLVVAGGPETGKTAMLERLIHNNYHPDKKFYSTKEDIYLANIQIRGRAETLRIHDTSGTNRAKFIYHFRVIYYSRNGISIE